MSATHSQPVKSLDIRFSAFVACQIDPWPKMEPFLEVTASDSSLLRFLAGKRKVP